MDAEHRLVLAKRKRAGGGREWEVGVSRYKCVCVGWINNKLLPLYSTQNYSRYPMINHDGKIFF